MADVHQQKKEGPALFNWMQYVLKHIIVRSENLFQEYQGSKRVIVQWGQIHSGDL